MCLSKIYLYGVNDRLNQYETLMLRLRDDYKILRDAADQGDEFAKRLLKKGERLGIWPSGSTSIE